MAKRFIDSTLFRKPLVRALDAPSKLLWIYIQCECDHAGFWIPEMDVVASRLGVKMSEEKALEKLEGLVRVMPAGEWWVVDFVPFQYGTLKPENRVHEAVMNLLSERGLLGQDQQPIYKPLTSPFQGAMDKERDKERGKEPVKAEGVQGEAKDERFELLWKTFEGKGAKAKAREYWLRLTEEDRADITAKAPAYCASTSGERLTYRKNIEGWINPAERRWEAPIITPRGTAMQVALHSADVPPEAYSES